MNQLNGMARSVFQDLVEKRLWPVALALAIALVAIPVVLSKPAGPAPVATPIAPTAPATGSGGALSAFEPAVSSEGSKSSEIRKALKGFNSKDPFEVQGLSKGTSAGGDEGSVQVGGTTPTVTGGSDSSSTSGTTTVSPDSTSGSGDSTATSAPEVKYYKYTADVRFGKQGNLDKKNLERFRALPSSQNPVVVFMGTTDGGDDAVFMVSATSPTTGEGDCQPDDTCTFLYMQPGQTQSFEAIDANDQVITYVLKLLDIKAEETEAPKASTSSKRAARNARDERVRGFTSRIEALGF